MWANIFQNDLELQANLTHCDNQMSHFGHKASV